MQGILAILYKYTKYTIFKKLAILPIINSFMNFLKTKISNVKGALRKVPILFSFNLLKTL